MTEAQTIAYSNSKYIFIDMDGTLIETNSANNEAYKTAIHSIVGENFNFNGNRITSETIKSLYSESTAKRIIEEKNKIASDFVSLTSVNTDLVGFIMKCEKPCYLVSNSNEERGENTIKYHKLDKILNNCYFFSGDKYSQAIKALNVLPQDIFVFENEKTQAETAIKNGINSDSIYLFKIKSKRL